MGKKLTVVLFMLMAVLTAGAVNLWQGFERSAFYQAMASGNLSEVNSQIELLQAKSGSAYAAFEGALLMRKAGLVAVPKAKLKYFKEGRKQFQTAFNADSNNAEYRFLRLSIQEHAPKIVKYRSNISADKIYIATHFKSLQPVVQKAVTDYSKTSKILRPEDF